MGDEESIFTKILKGEIPGQKVYEDDDVFAIMDIMPANKGHCLVIPKQQVENATECPDELLGKVTAVAKKVGQAITKAVGCNGYNLLINNGKAAGQVVFHLHMHVIPRYEDDNVEWNWHNEQYADNEMNELCEKIKESL